MIAPTIRPASRADLACVAGIFAHYVHHTVATFAEVPPTEAEWAGKLADLNQRDLPFLVAEVSGAVRGFAYVSPWRPKAAYRHTVEDTIYLAPEVTGRGLGTALLGAIIDAAAEAGRRQMIAVIADTGSDASAALHRRFGFTDVGRLTGVGYKHGRWVDTTLMQLALKTR